MVNKEHQSRYYQTHSCALYGMIVDSRVEDRNDLSNSEKAALLALFQSNNLPPIVTESHIVCSEDTVHDPSAVINFNGKNLLP